MKQQRFTFSGFAILLLGLTFPALLLAQDDKEKDKKKEKSETEQIIITRKGKGDDKVVVEISGDKVTVNGKPLEDYKDEKGNISVRKSKGYGLNSLAITVPRGQSSLWSFDDNNNVQLELEKYYADRAMLGVSTEKTEEGVKVQSITKESGAEKAGLQKGDIILSIDDTKIETPDDLSKAVRQHKPGDKVTVTYQRDKKQNKATAELTKWKGITAWTDTWSDNFNFDHIVPKLQAIPQLKNFRYEGNYDFNLSGSTPKLGLSVQDTDEGTGVKVIDVDKDSNAEKAGIKKDDIITDVDNTVIKGTDDIVKTLKASKEKGSVLFKLKRNGKTQSIEVRMPKKIKTADL